VDKASPGPVPLSNETGLRLWQPHSAARQGFAYGSPTQQRDRASPMAVPLSSETGLRLWQSQRVLTDYLACCDGGPTSNRSRVRENTLWCALSEVKRTFVVVVLATVSYSWPHPKRSLTYCSSSALQVRYIALEVVVVDSRRLYCLENRTTAPSLCGYCEARLIRHRCPSFLW
jgi:hypothetical protein